MLQTSPKHLPYVLEHLIVGEGRVLHHPLMLADWEHWSIIALDIVSSVYLTSLPLYLPTTLYMLYL